MAVDYSSTLKSTRMAAVITACDAHASPATLEICTTAYGAVLATLTLADPSFTESGGVITLDNSPAISATASGTGTAAVARIKEGGGTTIINNLTVGTSATNIVLNSTSITSGQTVTLTGTNTITHG